MSGFAMRLFTQVFILSAVLVLPGAAAAQPMIQSQEGIALQNEIEQLQSQVQQLQSNTLNNGGSVLGGNAPPPPAPEQNSGPVAGGVVTSLLTQVQQLQAQVQTLNGEVDTLQNQVTTQNAQTQKEIGDLKFQMSNGAPGAATTGAAPGAGPGTAPDQPQSLTPPAASAPQAAAPMVSGDPKTQLHAALEAYAQRNYATSAAMAEALVKNDGQAPEAYRAQYLVAQSQDAAGNAQDAAIAYDNTYNLNRTGAYAPQSLLGLASSLHAIGANDEACSTLSSLNSQFPTPPAGMQPRIDQVSKAAHCQ